MGQHTPGPWQVSKTIPKGRLVVECEDGTQDIAFIDGFGFLSNATGKAELEANACLIAAAPDLLAALLAMLDEHADCKGCSASELALAAIAKVKGA